MSAGDVPQRHLSVAAARRERLNRMFVAVRQEPTAEVLDELQKVLARAAPDRAAMGGYSHHIGMQAGTLNKSNLTLLKRSGFCFHKVDGIGMLGAMFNPAYRAKAAAGERPTQLDANTLVLISRNGTFVVDNVVLPLRKGSILMDGELCIRKRELSAAERERLDRLGKESTLIGTEYLDPDDGDPSKDSQYELCYAAHDMIVDDNATSVWAARNKDTVSVLDPFDRLRRLLAATQRSPISDAQADRAVQTGVADLGGREPTVKIFVKMPWFNREFYMQHRLIPPCLKGIPLDGVVFLGPSGPYMVGESNPELLKYKAWDQNTTDMVVVRVDDRPPSEYAYRFFVVKLGNTTRDVSGTMFLGDTEEERRISIDTLALEDQRLAAGGAKETPLIFEFAPSLADPNAFYALRDKEFESDGKRLLAAIRMLRWRPTGIVRTDRSKPNSEANVFNIVDALLNYPSIDDIKKQLRPQAP